MKRLFFLAMTLTLPALQSCQNEKRDSVQDARQHEPPTRHETPQKMIEELVGEWVQANADGSGNNDRQANAIQTLTFTEEARYIVREGDQKTDSGAFRMNEQLKNLYFESEATEDPREFEVQLRQDTLILSEKDDGQGRDEEYVYVKRN